jgi:uncharacterized iron-regulated membrane protein
MEDLKKAKYVGHIANYFIESIAAWFILAMVSGVMLLLDFKKPTLPYWGQVMLPVMCGLLAWAVATFVRIIRIFKTILLSE